MKKVFITGISGTGKTAIANALRAEGINAVDMDENDLCYWISKDNSQKVDYEAELNKEFIDSHIWICDLAKLKKMLDTEVSVMLGHPENTDEILPFFEKFFLLQCKPETFLKRITERKDNDFGKHETARQYLLDTYKKFEDDMISKGAIPINAGNSLEKVVKDIISKIE